jgi:hypothetical protein
MRFSVEVQEQTVRDAAATQILSALCGARQSARQCRNNSLLVIPAQAGIHLMLISGDKNKNWIPAFAGMTIYSKVPWLFKGPLGGDDAVRRIKPPCSPKPATRESWRRKRQCAQVRTENGVKRVSRS